MFRWMIIVVFLPSVAISGAWPRGKGNGFVSAARTELYYPHEYLETYSTFYGEYGLTEKMTLGVDYGRGISGKEKTILFLSRSFKRPDRKLEFSAEIGLGKVAGANTMRPGISLGRSFKTMLGYAWATADFQLEYRIDDQELDLKSDITLGLNIKDKTKAILQIQSGIQSGDPEFVRLVPSTVYEIMPKTYLEFATPIGIVGDSGVGVKLGLWRKF